VTRSEFNQMCTDICPHCKALSPLRWRDGTSEWVHDTMTGRGVTHAFCLASHFRNKWQDSLND